MDNKVNLMETDVRSQTSCLLGSLSDSFLSFSNKNSQHAFAYQEANIQPQPELNAESVKPTPDQTDQTKH